MVAGSGGGTANTVSIGRRITSRVTALRPMIGRPMHAATARGMLRVRTAGALVLTGVAPAAPSPAIKRQIARTSHPKTPPTACPPPPAYPLRAPRRGAVLGALAATD